MHRVDAAQSGVAANMDEARGSDAIAQRHLVNRDARETASQRRRKFRQRLESMVAAERRDLQ
jgi:hypothetical protein